MEYIVLNKCQEVSPSGGDYSRVSIFMGVHEWLRRLEEVGAS